MIVFIPIPTWYLPTWYYLAREKKIGPVYSGDISPPENVLIRGKMSELNETRWTQILGLKRALVA